MLTKPATIITLILLLVLGWVLLSPHVTGSFKMTVNGEEVSNPLVRLLGGGVALGVVAALLFCGGMVLLFFVSGVAIAAAVTMVLLGLVICAIAVPLLLPLLLPLGGLLYLLMRNRRPDKPLPVDMPVDKPQLPPQLPPDSGGRP